jgi:DNA-directed RNA polymerase I, II, and III subunit RPABC2
MSARNNMTGGYFSGGEGSDEEDNNSDSTDTKSNADSDVESDTEYNEVEGEGEGDLVKPVADEEEGDGEGVKDDDASEYSDGDSDINEAEEDADGDEDDTSKITKSVNTKAIKPVDIYTNLGDENEADDDEEDEDENYLQKFDADVNKNYIIDFHPECVISNYDEIATLTVVTRDNYNIIIDDLHRTAPYLSKYERARILGQRAKQINAGAPAFVKVPEKVMDGYLIAELELMQKTIPFIIRRPLPNGGSEYWKLTDLENISF